MKRGCRESIERKAMEGLQDDIALLSPPVASECMQVNVATIPSMDDILSQHVDLAQVRKCGEGRPSHQNAVTLSWTATLGMEFDIKHLNRCYSCTNNNC